MNVVKAIISLFAIMATSALITYTWLFMISVRHDVEKISNTLGKILEVMRERTDKE